MKQRSALSLVTAATVIGGLAGYVITWLVPRQIGFAEYSTFAIFWAYLFLLISGLSGIQQEVTRATRRAQPRALSREHQARNFGFSAAAATLIAILATAPLWQGGVFPQHGWALVWPLAIGASSYVLVAVLYGALYGTAQWWSLFWLISVDAVMRLAAIAVVLIFTFDLRVLAWAAVIPFPLTIAILWLYVRFRVSGGLQFDVGYRQLSWNVLRTVMAAASMGMLVSGFPMLLGVTSRGESMEVLGLVILAATLVRAPLIVVSMAFQSYLVVLFRDRARGLWKIFLALQSVILGVGVVLGIAGWWLGPPVFAMLFPGELVPDGWLIAVLVVSSALVAAMFVSAAAALSQSRHAIYTAGWVVAAVLTVACLLTPVDIIARTVLALLIGPVGGLIVQGGYLAISARSHSQSPTQSAA